jgi:hypothetical protein
MDLDDILYVTSGSLEVTRLPNGPAGEPVYEAALYDTIHDPCMLKGKGLKPEPGSEWMYAQARAKGLSPDAALDALTTLVAGAWLGHDWPVMWTSSTEWVRIPPNLTKGNPPINVRRPYPLPEESDDAAAS